MYYLFIFQAFLFGEIIKSIKHAYISTEIKFKNQLMSNKIPYEFQNNENVRQI